MTPAEPPALPNVHTALAWARLTMEHTRAEEEGRDAPFLLAHLLGRPSAYVLAHPEHKIPHSIAIEFHRLIDRLAGGEPLAYLTGEREFYGWPFFVSADTLIPRPETELMVERALAWIGSHPLARQIADVGTGSGCIAISIAKTAPSVQVAAGDISAPALKVARRNVDRHHMARRVRLVQTDLLAALPGPFHIICANLPYIPTAVLAALDVARFEPRVALDGGPDGLRLIERLLAQCTIRLVPGGLLLCEIEASQASATMALARQYFPRAEICVSRDYAGHDRLLEINTY